MMLFASGIDDIQNANAAEHALEPANTLEKALTMAEIIGLDTSKYDVKIDLCHQDLYGDILPQENIDYTFESDKSTVRVMSAYINGNLRALLTDIVDGKPLTMQSQTNTLESTKKFLNNYQPLTDTDYTKMLQMLDDVVPNKSTTKSSENIKLQVTCTEDTADFRWTYVDNEVEAAIKCVALHFEQGFLKYFVDTWNIFKIGNNSINLSEPKAVEVAMNRAKDYTYLVSLGGEDDNLLEVAEFTVTWVIETKLDFGNYLEVEKTRGGDPFTLYPSWHVKLSFDDVYPGNVYGLDITIWADTKEISDIQTLSWLGTSIQTVGGEEGNINPRNNLALPQLMWIAIPFVIGSAFLSLLLVVKQKKQKKGVSFDVQDVFKRFVKAKRALLALCLLTMLAVIPIATPVASASRSIAIFGSTHNITTSEKNAATMVTSYMDDCFTYDTNYNYDSFNAFGSYTLKSNVLSYAPSLEQSYDHVAIFHYGHGGLENKNGLMHWSYFDNTGVNSIWDYEIYPVTSQSKVWFVMLWTCWQGNAFDYPHTSSYNASHGMAAGMPLAWHHPLNNAYDCFIGFKGASMPLTQQSIHYPYLQYLLWLSAFVHHGTAMHRTIANSLDWASLDRYNISFSQTELNTGYNAAWYGSNGALIGTGAGQMVIAGNRNLYVY
ncbi:MAG: hypothetical protein LBC12_02805 [Nitrososphaerota archaeon]|nr:hypothetical protein [Nitrososphaerota archaeon]